MRRLNRQPKDSRQVSIPAELVEFMREVDSLIAKRDDRVTIESDDLVQCERAYGGLIEDGGGIYGFTYFPEDGIRQLWELELSTAEIGDIARGNVSALDLWFCRTPDCRCGFQDPDDTCFHCDYEDDGTG